MKGITKHIFQFVLVLGLLLAGEGLVWGASHYQAKMTVEVSSTGHGTVYLDNDESKKNITKDAGVDKTYAKIQFILNSKPDTNYHLDSWNLTKSKNGDNDEFDKTSPKVTVTVYSPNNSSDCDSSSGGGIEDGFYTNNYTATATFAHDTFTLKFDKNDGGRGVTGGPMSDQPVERNVSTAINKNEFVLDYVVTYNANGGKVNGKDEDSETKTRFTKWKAYYDGTEVHTEKPILDKERITWDEDHGKTFTLKATWADKVDFTFPEATRGDREHKGWFYSSTDPSTKKGDANQTVSMTTATLYAQWGDPFYARLNLSADTGASGEPTVDETEKPSDKKNDDLVFNIEARAAKDGYVFDGWTGTGVKFGDEKSLKTTATVKSSSTAGSSNAKTYDIKATYKAEYGAKLSTAISSVSDASSSTAKVSLDGSTWADSQSCTSNTANEDITFNVKAEAADGYRFVGWSLTNGSSDTIPGLESEDSYVVKTSGTPGAINEKTLYAIFKKKHSIVINANCEISRPDERVVFLVSGLQNYEVSVPVGGTITLYDVEPGDYTITPEAAWSWNYTVSEAQTTSFDPTTKVSTNTFTVTPKGSEKKHTEKTSTTVY
ncbi:MAG: hypothetical protein MJY89_07965 [Bacteroidales bacterium]|nr:hypothetical protein [Bacteroidales bacterium]